MERSKRWDISRRREEKRNKEIVLGTFLRVFCRFEFLVYMSGECTERCCDVILSEVKEDVRKCVYYYVGKKGLMFDKEGWSLFISTFSFFLR